MKTVTLFTVTTVYLFTKQIENKISEKSSNNKMYYISTNNAEKVKKILDNKKITNYIIKSIN